MDNLTRPLKAFWAWWRPEVFVKWFRKNPIVRVLQTFSVAAVIVSLFIALFQLRADHEVREQTLISLAWQAIRVADAFHVSGDIGQLAAIRLLADRGLLAGADLSDRWLANADFRNAKLIRTDLNNSVLKGAIFRDAELAGAIFFDADLSVDQSLILSGFDSAFDSAFERELTDQNLDQTAATLAHPTDLSGADLRVAEFLEADLTGADLTGANIRGADLTRATLTGANLTGADLSAANFEGVRTIARDQYAVACIRPGGSQPQNVHLDDPPILEVCERYR